jgi:hypothetical protein
MFGFRCFTVVCTFACVVCSATPQRPALSGPLPLPVQFAWVRPLAFLLRVGWVSTLSLPFSLLLPQILIILSLGLFHLILLPLLIEDDYVFNYFTVCVCVCVCVCVSGCVSVCMCVYLYECI